MKRIMHLIFVFMLLIILTAGCSGNPGPNQKEAGGADYVEQNEAEESQDTDASLRGIAGNNYEYDEADEDVEADGTQGDFMAKSQGAEEASLNDGQTDPAAADTGSSGSNQAGNQAAGQGGSKDQEKAADPAADSQAKKETMEEKLVYNCNLTIETVTYKKTMEEIEKQIKAYGGIIESQNEYDNDSGWYLEGHTRTYGTMESTIVVRVPSKDYQAFLKSLDGTGKMTHKSMDVTNISRSYYSTKTTIEALKVQEKRLLKMMEEAKTIEDMITVEKRLTEVQTQLDQYQTQLSVMDTQVAYSTVTMTIREVLEYKPEEAGKKTNTFAQRLSNTLEESWTGFLSFMEGLLFLLIRLLPFAVVAAIIFFLTRPLRRKFMEGHRERKEIRAAAKAAAKAAKAEARTAKEEARIAKEAARAAGKQAGVTEGVNKAALEAADDVKSKAQHPQTTAAKEENPEKAAEAAPHED